MQRSIQQDINHLLRILDGLTASQVTFISMMNEQKCDMEVCVLKFMFAPKEGLYRGGKFIFQIQVHEQYPLQMPEVSCLTPIYHPNIDTLLDGGYVCVSTLNEWNSSFGIDDVIQAILFLLYNPCVEESLFPLITFDMDLEEYATNVRKTLRGEEVEDVLWPLNMNVDYPPSVTDVKYNFEPSEKPANESKNYIDIPVMTKTANCTT